MAGTARSGADRRRRRVLATRALLFLTMAVGATLTGVWWDHARTDGLSVGADLTVQVKEGHDGAVVVEETLAFDEGRLGEEELVRTIDPTEGGQVLLDDIEADDPDEVLVAPRPDDGLTLTVAAEAGSPVTVTYELRGAGEPLDLGTLNADLDGLGLRANQTITEPPTPPEEDDVPWNAIGLAVGAVAFLAWLASLRASRRDTPDLGTTAGGLPSSHSPAEVGWLLRHGRVTLADLAATVVDLTARGFVLPYRRDDELVLGQGRPAVELDPHEALVLAWLFPGWAREADLAAKRAAISENPSIWPALWNEFVDDVERVGQDDGLIERDVASPAVLTVAACGLALLVAGVVGTARGHPGWVGCVVTGSLVVAGATAFARRSPEGEVLAVRWEAFGAELRAGAEVTPHALAYAVTLGEEDAARARLADDADDWPAQLVHGEVERRVTAWREAYLTATSVRGEPSERLRALLSLRILARSTHVRPG